MRRFRGTLLLACLALLVAACGSSSGDGNASISGVVYAPNGVDPVPGAEVRAVSGESAGSLSTRALWHSGESAATAVSGPDGGFTLSGLLPGDYRLIISHGLFETSSSVSVANGVETRLAVQQTTLPKSSDGGANSAPRIAVVTGEWDEMANVLAKFGMGQVDDNGALRLGTETFTLYVGSSGHSVWNADGESFDWVPYPESYPLADNLFRNLAAMKQYDVIVINCGADETSLLDPGEPGVRTNLREFVRLGGRLYVTDRGNDFAEQAFPGFIRYERSDNTAPTDPEPPSAAWVGQGAITSDAAIRDSALAAWLGGLGALNDDGSLHIEDFLNGWAVMVGPEPTADGSQVKVWVEGPVSIEGWDADGNFAPIDGGIRPLTVSFPFGNGKVIYTSYHTAGMPHPGYTPQERVLEYLLLL